jgi:IS30 family transposase
MRKKRHFSHLSLYEREQIFVYKHQGKSLREIGRLLKRNHSVISRELKRNNQPHELMTGYIGVYAHKQAKRRKIKSGQRERLKDSHIREYVQQQMKRGWTPEIIAHKVPDVFKGLSISPEAIYQYIYADWKEGIAYLPRRHPKRYSKHYTRKKQHPPIPNRVSIDQRPDGVNQRKQLGHWESDSIESSHSTVIVNVVYERKSRLVKLTRLANKTAELTKEALTKQLKLFPKKARKSVTYDNGCENYHHEQINQQLGTKSYFCNPYHSWEKGGVENSNGLIRRFIPKKTDLATINQQQLDDIENLLNNRPRKCLNFKTPAQVFLKACGAIPP